MIRSGNQDCVDIFPVEHLAKIDLLERLGISELLPGGAAVVPDVADANDFDTVDRRQPFH